MLCLFVRLVRDVVCLCRLVMGCCVFVQVGKESRVFVQVCKDVVFVCAIGKGCCVRH